MITRTLEQRRAQTANARAARLQRHLQRREAAARAVEDEVGRGIAEARAAAAATALVPFGMSASTANTVSTRRAVVPAVSTQESLMCIECLGTIGSDLYIHCVRCNGVLHPSCGIRGQDAVGPTVEVFCSDCSDAMATFREAQEAEGAVLVQRRTARAVQAAGAVVDSAFATGAAAGAAAATMVRAAGALARGVCCWGGANSSG